MHYRSNEAAEKLLILLTMVFKLNIKLLLSALIISITFQIQAHANLICSQMLRAPKSEMLDFSGNTKISPNQVIDMSLDGMTFSFSSKNLSSLSKNDLRRTVSENIKALSTNAEGIAFREVGAFIIEVKGEEPRVQYFSSNSPTEIVGAAAETALNEINFFTLLETHPESIVSVTHIHSHPGPEFRVTPVGTPLYFSITDIDFYINFTRLMSSRSGITIPFAASVVPVCENCGDIFFHLN